MRRRLMWIIPGLVAVAATSYLLARSPNDLPCPVGLAVPASATSPLGVKDVRLPQPAAPNGKLPDNRLSTWSVRPSQPNKQPTQSSQLHHPDHFAQIIALLHSIPIAAARPSSDHRSKRQRSSETNWLGFSEY